VPFVFGTWVIGRDQTYGMAVEKLCLGCDQDCSASIVIEAHVVTRHTILLRQAPQCPIEYLSVEIRSTVSDPLNEYPIPI
jgi:hypothetical protein